MEESFGQLEEQAKQATTIEELFCLWKRAHAAEVKEGNWEKTCQFKEKDKGKKHHFDPQKAAKENFTKDGRLGNAQKGGVLFICKESNLSRDEDTDKKLSENEEACVKAFWLREEVVLNQPSICDPSQMKIVKSAKTHYRNCLEKTLSELSKKGYPAPKNLEDCAYMNLNKRGGNSTCNKTVLAAYIKKYKTFLQREIELLQCDVAVLYSASIYGKKAMKMIEQIFRGAGVKTVVKINCHPSRYSNQKIENMEITKNP